MKIIVRLLLVLVLAGAAAMVGVKQSAIATARAEHRVLLEQSEAARKLAEANKGVAPARGDEGELEKLRAQNKDLPKLRNEVRQLRRQAEEMARLRAENQRLQEGILHPPSNYVSRASLADVGLGTPEAAVQTMFWALNQGNMRRLLECGTPEMAKMIPAGVTDEQFHQESVKFANTFPGFRITETEQVSADEVVMKVQLLEESDGGTLDSVHLKRVGNEWKVSQFGR